MNKTPPCLYPFSDSFLFLFFWGFCLFFFLTSLWPLLSHTGTSARPLCPTSLLQVSRSTALWLLLPLISCYWTSLGLLLLLTWEAVCSGINHWTGSTAKCERVIELRGPKSLKVKSDRAFSLQPVKVPLWIFQILKLRLKARKCLACWQLLGIFSFLRQNISHYKHYFLIHNNMEKVLRKGLGFSYLSIVTYIKSHLTILILESQYQKQSTF